MTTAIAEPAADIAAGRRARQRLAPEVWIPLVLIAGALGYPAFLLVTSAFNVGDPQALPAREYGFGNFVELLNHLDWLRNTLVIATGGTLLGITIGVGLAWTIHRTTVPGRKWFELLVAIPYPLGPLVGALAWSQLGAPRDGLINRAFMWLTGANFPLIDIYTPLGIIFVEAIFEAPVAVLIIGAAMQRMDPALEESSSIFGGGKWRTALKITLPLMLPAILSAALFMFTSIIGSFAIPTILGTSARFYVATNAIYVLMQGYPPNYPLAAALGLVLIVITGVAVWLVQRVLRGRSFVVVSGRNYRPRQVDIRGWTWLLFTLASFYILISLVLPLGALFLASVQTSSDLDFNPAQWTLANYKYVVIDFPTTRQAIVNSLILGVGTGTIGVACATLIAIAVHRSQSRGRKLLEQVTMLPQAFPRLIFAFGFLWMVLTLPIPLYGTLFAVLLAYIVVFLPLAYRGMSGVVVQIDGALEEAARVGGASWGRVLRTVTVPLLRSGILATWALLFMVSVREISASLFLSDAHTPVLGPAIFSFWDSGGLPRVSALAIVQALIILVALYAVRRWAGREVKV
ncbi:MAG: ABC transporter permease [Variibacter sp.]